MDETAARKHLAKLQWPEGRFACCAGGRKATLLTGPACVPGIYKCRPCQKAFSATVGTVFKRSHIRSFKLGGNTKDKIVGKLRENIDAKGYEVMPFKR